VAHAVHRRVTGDPGIVDQHIDRAEFGLDLLHAFGASVKIGDVEFEDRDAGLIVELLRRPVVTNVRRRDPVVGILQRHRDSAAHATGPARDHRHSSHAFLPFCG
jgi:hypothetical protein